MVFVISYPVMATFGLVLVGLTYIFSGISALLTRFNPSDLQVDIIKNEWLTITPEADLIEGKVHKQIMFGPVCYQLRRKDGIPSILEDHIFGKKMKVIEEGVLMERWNSTDLKNLPDFDICLYAPDDDKLTTLINIKCFDWHLSEKKEKDLLFKWFDGTQGGEVKVAL